LLDKIKNSKLVKLGFCQNYWITFHIYSAMFGVIIMEYFKLSDGVILSISFIIMNVWELIEFKFEIIDKMNKLGLSYVDWSLTNYKYKEKWLYDTIGDILGAFIVVVLMIVFKNVILR